MDVGRSSLDGCSISKKEVITGEDVAFTDTDRRSHTAELCHDFVNVCSQVKNRLFEGFKGDHHLSLNLDSLLVVVLVPDFVASVKLIDLFVEIGAGEDFTVRLAVVLRAIDRRLEVILVGLSALVAAYTRHRSGRGLHRCGRRLNRLLGS